MRQRIAACLMLGALSLLLRNVRAAEATASHSLLLTQRMYSSFTASAHKAGRGAQGQARGTCNFYNQTQIAATKVVHK